MVDIRKSAAQNVDDLCFSSKGFLRSEFDNLYASLFRKAEKHISVIEALAKKMKGLETKKALFLTFITPFGLNSNAHSQSLVQNTYSMDILFEDR